MIDFLHIPIISKLLQIICCLIISYIIYEIIKTIMNKRNTTKMKKRKQTIRKLILNIIKYTIIIFASLIILSILGVNVTSILAGLGIVGIVLGLALQDIMKDIFSGISIILEDQFDIGDYVEINGFEGTITELSLKSTKIRTYENVIKTISNRTIESVTNYCKSNINLAINIPIPYEITTKKAEELIDKIIDKITKEISDLTGEIINWNLNKFEGSYVKYTILVPVKPEDQFMIKRQINKIIKEEFDKSKISIPYNIIEVKNG